jgi:lipoprotein-anchoring transpeptidase ErfK/SrfK
MCLAATAAGFIATRTGWDVARARHRRGGRWVVVAVTLGVLAVVTAGTAFAAYQYDASTSDRILPGVSVGGVDVGGMKRDEAVRTLRELAEPTLYSELVVEAAGHSWNVTPASLGMTANVDGAVARALAVADDLSLTARVYHRLRDVPVDVSLDLVFDERRREVKAFVQQAFDEVALPAVDARFALVDGELVTSRSHTGRELAIGAATDRILEALGQRTDAIEVPVRTVEPSVTTAALGQSIVVDLSENQLYLYDGLKVVADYPVATAAAGYTTPVGTWEVVDKRENPTWYNPAEDTWGADLPPVIEPGPGNPLGTRAIYLNAPGIRIHGTYSSSSIGTYASHGCIRMYISDSEELFDLVDTGTRVIIKP